MKTSKTLTCARILMTVWLFAGFLQPGFGQVPVSGTVAYFNTYSTPMDGIWLYLTSTDGVVFDSTQTGQNGSFSFPDVAPGNYFILSSCHKTPGGMASSDALLVLQHFAGMITQTGLKLKAADVDASRNVNSIDALKIALRFVGLIQTFPAGDWAFTRDTVYVTGNQPVNIQIYSLCYGDVNASFAPAGCQPWPHPASAGLDRLNLPGSSCYLTSNAPTINEVGTYTLLSGNGGSFADPHDPYTAFSGIAGETYVITWSLSTNCYTYTDTVTISFCPVSTPANAGPDLLNIPGTSVNVAANVPAAGEQGTWWLPSVIYLVVSDIHDPAALVTGEPGMSYQLIWRITNFCGSTSADTVIVSFGPAGPGSHTCGKPLFDTRDGKSYTTDRIGNQCWMRQDLNVGVKIDSASGQSDNGIIEKYCYNDKESLCDVYGGLYQWNEMMQYSDSAGVQGICPLGWHVPSDAEFCTAATFIDPTVNCASWSFNGLAGGKMKEAGFEHWIAPNAGATNKSGFTGLGSGYRYNTGYYSSLKYANILWTSDDFNGSKVGWFLFHLYESIERLARPGDFGFAVRCLKNGCSGVSAANAGPDQLDLPDTATLLAANVPAANETGIWHIVGGEGGILADSLDPQTQFRGIAGNAYTLAWTVLNDCFASSDTITVSFGQASPACPGLATLSYCGKTYHTVKIGTQCWLRENLDAGTMVDVAVNQADNGIIEKYCYNNDPANCLVYGGLYQWDEMMQYVYAQGTRGICPEGWRLPSESDWCTLATYLDPAVDCQVYSSGTDAGGKLKEAGTLHWTAPNAGATNSSGFTGLPAGQRRTNGTFMYLNNFGMLWSSAENNASSGKMKQLSYLTSLFTMGSLEKGRGLSVRCLKDSCVTVTPADAGPDQTGLVSTTALLAANAPGQNETGTWAVVSGTGGNFGNIHSASTNFQGLAGNAYTLTWTLANNCSTSADTLLVSFCAAITQADAGPDQLNLEDTTATLAANAPAAGETGTWSLLSGAGGMISNLHDPAGTFHGNEGITYQLKWTISDSCGFTADTVTLSFAAYGPHCPGLATLVHEGRTYHTLLIGARCWLRENLNSGVMVNAGQDQTNDSVTQKYCYDNDTSKCKIYGGLYQWNEAMQYVTQEGARGICPGGWHIPAKSEWNTLAAYLGGSSVAGGKMKESGSDHWSPPNLGATNESGFTGRGSGNRDQSGSFMYLKICGGLWSSTELFSGTRSYLRRMTSGSSSIDQIDDLKVQGYAVRCIRDTCDPVTTANAGPDQPEVAADSIILAANAPGPGETGTWHILTGTGGAFADSLDPLTSFTGIPDSAYTLRWTITNGCSSSSDQVTVSFAPAPAVACPEGDTLIYEGKLYHTVQIGTQCWLRDNLNVGTLITSTTAPADNGVIEKFCVGDAETSCDIYGGLYNWNELMDYTTQEGARGICPPEWHVPSAAEFCTLLTYLDPTVDCGNTTGETGTDAGGKLKITGNDFWEIPNTGATNSSGFTALGCGFLDPSWGNAVGVFQVTYFYGSSRLYNSLKYSAVLFHDSQRIKQSYTGNNYAFSVRCMKD